VAVPFHCSYAVVKSRGESCFKVLCVIVDKKTALLFVVTAFQCYWYGRLCWRLTPKSYYRAEQKIGSFATESKKVLNSSQGNVATQHV